MSVEPPPWPERPTLDDAIDKLARAKKHLKTLRDEIEPIEQRDAHTIGFKVDADTGEYAFYIEGLEELPENEWGLMIGDCLHNARTALDYLMVRLVALVRQVDPREIDSVQFPIYDDAKGFPGAVGALRKEPHLSGYLTRIEELQPFNRGNPSVWGEYARATSPGTSFPVRTLPVQHALPVALNRLSRLDNIDKHRIIHTAWLALQVEGEPATIFAPLNVPADFKITWGEIDVGALEDGAKVGSVGFNTPLPHDWEPEQMNMKRQFPLGVMMLDEASFAANVLHTLDLCLWGVESVLTIFGPVFAPIAAPPLPVTAIPNP